MCSRTQLFVVLDVLTDLETNHTKLNKGPEPPGFFFCLCFVSRLQHPKAATYSPSPQKADPCFVRVAPVGQTADTSPLHSAPRLCSLRFWLGCTGGRTRKTDAYLSILTPVERNSPGRGNCVAAWHRVLPWGVALALPSSAKAALPGAHHTAESWIARVGRYGIFHTTPWI